MTATGLVLRQFVRATALSCAAAFCLCPFAAAQSWARLSAPFGDAIGGADSRPLLVFDWQRQRAVMRAGDGDMYDWDGNLWRHIQAARGSRRWGQAVYDLANGRMLVADDLGNVRSWNGHAWSDLPGPPLRVAAWAFDLVRLQVVALTAAAGVTETWALTGSTWSRLPTVHVPTLGSMAFDVGRDRLVSFGLAPSGMVETWEYDRSDWTNVHSAPGSYSDVAPLVYDLQGRSVVAVGNGTARRWDGSSWTLAASNLTTGQWPQLVYDGANHRVLWLPDTALRGVHAAWRLYALRGAGEQAVAAAPFATPGVRSGMTFDLARGRAVLFGGGSYNLPADAHDRTFEWDGRQWLTPTPSVRPPARRHCSLTYDSTRGRVMMFGGSLHGVNGLPTTMFGDLWSWDGTTWTQEATLGPPRSNALLQHDVARARTVLIGGWDMGWRMDDLWEWDGTAWTPGPAPPPRAPDVGAEGVTYDTRRSRLVLFRQHVQLAPTLPVDILEFDGASWVHRQTASIATAEAGAAYLPRRGTSTFGSPRSLLEWDGSTATVVTYPPWPGPFLDDQYFDMDAQLVFDDARDRLLYYDGQELFGLSGTIRQVADLAGGCGAGRAPLLTARGVPRPGNGDFVLEFDGSANAPFAIGWSAASRSTPLGAGCTLLLDATMCVVLGVTTSTGLGDVQLEIPAALGLRGLSFVLQGTVLDPLSPIGLWFSQGLRVAVGD